MTTRSITVPKKTPTVKPKKEIVVPPVEKVKYQEAADFKKSTDSVVEDLKLIETTLMYKGVKVPKGVVFPTKEEIDGLIKDVTLVNDSYKSLLLATPKDKNSNKGLNIPHYYNAAITNFVKSFVDGIELPMIETKGSIMKDPLIKKVFNKYCSDNSLKVNHKNRHAIELNEELLALLSTVHKGIRSSKRIGDLPGKGYRTDGQKQQVEGIDYVTVTGEGEKIYCETFYFMQLLQSFKMSDYHLLNFTDKQKATLKSADETVDALLGKGVTPKIKSFHPITPLTFSEMKLHKDTFTQKLTELKFRFYPDNVTGSGSYDKKNYVIESKKDTLPPVSKAHFVHTCAKMTKILEQYKKAYNAILGTRKNGTGPDIIVKYDENIFFYLNLDRFCPPTYAAAKSVTQLLALHTQYKGFNQKLEVDGKTKTIFVPDDELREIIAPFLEDAVTSKGKPITFENLTLQKMQNPLHKLYEKVTFDLNNQGDVELLAKIKEGEKYIDSRIKEHNIARDTIKLNEILIKKCETAFEKGKIEYPNLKSWVAQFKTLADKLKGENNQLEEKKETIKKEFL